MNSLVAFILSIAFFSFSLDNFLGAKKELNNQDECRKDGYGLAGKQIGYACVSFIVSCYFFYSFIKSLFE